MIARHDLENATPRPMGGHSLLGVSEIGLVTEDVRDTVPSLRSGLGLRIYRGSVDEAFTALGDEHGLLIVVKRGRVWFPDTGKEAGWEPVTSLVSGDGDEAHGISSSPYQITKQDESHHVDGHYA